MGGKLEKALFFNRDRSVQVLRAQMSCACCQHSCVGACWLAASALAPARRDGRKDQCSPLAVTRRSERGRVGLENMCALVQRTWHVAMLRLFVPIVSGVRAPLLGCDRAGCGNTNKHRR